ncbi:O-antigen ligase family protein [Sandaracinobacteroides hominis]|uniref:O-antigen ligase family protein n=1 Tax=Sandaracinobacteroides hominis TaxID=2780086 RepID=UPI0018F6BA21|nr:O-antigen ligase family protein [Sandaracinobacteroides hominis]
MSKARERILPPYTRQVNDWKHLALKTLGVAALIMFAMFMGFWLAVFGQLVVQGFVAVLGVLLLVLLWMAPDGNVDFRRSIGWYFMAYLASMLLWPGYLALNVQGLPWITPSRLMFALMVLMFLMQFSQSAESRRELAGVVSTSKLLFGLYALFIILQLLTVGLSRKMPDSAISAINFIVLWNLPMLVGLWVLMDDAMIKRLYRLVLWCMAILFVVCLIEYHLEQPFWANHIPRFLKVDPNLIEKILYSARRDDGRYRLRGIYPVALYFGQLVVLLTPFAMHAAFTAKDRVKPWAWALLVLTIFIAWATNTRTAFTGMILGVVMYVAVFALRRYLKPTHGSDVIGPAAMLAAPTFILIMGVLIASSRRMRMWTVGGQQHAGSDDVRQMQWTRAINSLTSNPLGNGAGRAAEIAGKPTADGTWIIDSYWINLLLDYGVVGFLCFIAFFGMFAFHGIRDSLRHDDESSQLCSVFAQSIILFLLTMYSLSFEGNFYFPMILAAGIAANRYRLAQLEKQAAPAGAMDLKGRALA